jgi:glycosyltransferase involved in cell wall biosynthesis
MQSNNWTTDYVTVVVFTFNSAKTVLETLESVRSQKDCLIELIVSDDCSTDGTQEVVTQWIEDHRSSFAACHTIFNPVNAGICQNVRRAYAKATGGWIKPIAGDDILLTNAISALHQSTCSVPDDIGIIVGRVETFSAVDGQYVVGAVLPSDDTLYQLDRNAPDLLEKLTRENTIPAPAAMVRRRDFEICGGVDESFVHLDDWPLWINMLGAGAKIKTVTNVIVGYRMHAGSITTRRCAATMNPQFLADLITFYESYQRRLLPTSERLDKALYVTRWRLALKLLRNKPSAYRATALLHIFSPLRWRRLFVALRQIAPSQKK